MLLSQFKERLGKEDPNRLAKDLNRYNEILSTESYQVDQIDHRTKKYKFPKTSTIGIVEYKQGEVVSLGWKAQSKCK